MDEIKNLLYDLAIGVVELFHENDRLKAENKELRAYREERVKEDQEYLQFQANMVGETLQALVNRVNRDEQEEKLYDIWAEGYADNSGCAGAVRLGSARGKTFKDACKTFAEEEESFRQYFDEEQMTYWGCSLFSNEAGARRASVNKEN